MASGIAAASGLPLLLRLEKQPTSSVDTIAVSVVSGAEVSIGRATSCNISIANNVLSGEDAALG
jgi:hypothetical protein